MSAPAAACESAARTRSSTGRIVVDLRPSTTPQWPWTVYSHRHTSVMTTSSGSSRLIARTAYCTGASACTPPNRRHPYRACRRAAPPDARGLDWAAFAYRFVHRELRHARHRPDGDALTLTASDGGGPDEHSAESRVSRTSERIPAVRRRRRGRRVRSSRAPRAASRGELAGVRVAIWCILVRWEFHEAISHQLSAISRQRSASSYQRSAER